MRKPSLWVLVLGAGVLLGLAGCGGGTPPPPSSITLTVVDAQNVGYAAAYQVGGGSWSAFTPNSTHTYTFNLSGNSKYGVAVRCNSTVPGNPPEVHVIQATNAELANPKITCSSPNPTTVSYTLTVDVTAVPGIASGDQVVVGGQNFATFSASVQSQGQGQSQTFTASVNLSLPSGAQDLGISVVDTTSSNPLNVRAAKVLRNVSISSGGSSSYTFTSGDVLPQGNVSVGLPAGFSPDFGQALIFYLSRDNKGLGLVGGASGTAAVNFPYRPVAGFASGDRYVAYAVAGNTSNVLERLRGATGGNMTLVLPNPWPANSLTVSAEAHPVVNGLSYADPNLKGYEIALSFAGAGQPGPGVPTTYLARVSKGWLGNNNTYSVPDLSSLLTYTPFANGTNVDVSITAALSPANILNWDSSDPASFSASTDISLASVSVQYQIP